MQYVELKFEKIVPKENNSFVNEGKILNPRKSLYLKKFLK